MSLSCKWFAKGNFCTSEEHQEEYLDLSELIDDQKYDAIPNRDQMRPCVLQKIISRLFRVETFTDETDATVERLLPGLSLEEKMCNVLFYRLSSFQAILYYIDQGAPFQINEVVALRFYHAHRNFPGCVVRYTISSDGQRMSYVLIDRPEVVCVLSHVMAAGRPTMLEEMGVLLDRGADVNVQHGENHATLLMRWSYRVYNQWAMYGEIISMKPFYFLMERGADPYLEDKTGMNAVDYLQKYRPKARYGTPPPPQYDTEVERVLETMRHCE